MKILTIGDIHGRDIWKQLLKDSWQQAYDKVVFIGDYVDNWDQPVDTIISNFEEILALKRDFPDKVVLLFGNHEWHYLSDSARYSGYVPAIAEYMRDTLRAAIHRDHIQLSYTINTGPIPVLFTHAGITDFWWNSDMIPYIKRFATAGIVPQLTNDNLFEVIDPYLYVALKNEASILGACGKSSGGSHPTGSPIWARPEDMFRNGLPNCIHVVGHTYMLKGVTLSENNINTEASVKFLCVDALPSYKFSVDPESDKVHIDVSGYMSKLDIKKHVAVIDITTDSIVLSNWTRPLDLVTGEPVKVRKAKTSTN